ncbi:MAG TPA: DUF883 C-terminal domain-containing protein [Thermoanaerobaculia bacterium]|jgi:ElaB/YqjD/DUF883 family membrane-anchored ribosome-binding protein|nr:DUF883 C-terminal domain-containing protein [Thermoanaerobaculia bacterium]
MDEKNNSGTAGEAGEGEPAGRFGRAREYVGEKYETASGAVRDGYNSVREKVEDVDFGAITDQVRTYVRSNPGKALLISVGVGFLVGLLLRRDED